MLLEATQPTRKIKINLAKTTMKLIERFRRLNIWNKIEVVGGIASIIGLILLFWPKEQKQSANVTSYNQSGGITAYNVEVLTSSSYREMDINTEREIDENLSKIVRNYKDVNVQIIVEAESGNSIRMKIARKLGEVLREYRLGYYPEGNTFVGRFPNYPITVLCSTTNEKFAKDFIDSIRPYISGETDIQNNFSDDKLIKIYLNGFPTFSESGRVKFE